jgi:hypothetical protein
MAKRTKQDSTPEQVTPEGEPITNPEAQLPDAQPVVNEGNPAPEGDPSGNPEDRPGTASLPGSGLLPYDHRTREGELEAIRATGRPNPLEASAGSPPIAEGRQDINPVQQTGTDRHYATPADAKQEDVEASRGPDQSEAPAPFRRRDGFPDITSESVQVRMLDDYYPRDPSRYGNQLRASKGQLVSFGSDEALALIDAGLAERVDDESVGFQQDFPQPGEEPRPQGFLPVMNQETGAPEPPENAGSIDPSKAQSPTSVPDVEGLKASQEGAVYNVPEGQTVNPAPTAEELAEFQRTGSVVPSKDPEPGQP